MDNKSADNYELIINGLQEIIDPNNNLKNIIKTRPLTVYWGTAPTGRIHIGYFIPLIKIAELVDAGCHVTILIADTHAMLDKKIDKIELQDKITYYINILTLLLESLFVNMKKIKFVKGSSFQLTSEYVADIYKASTLVTINEAKHAGSEVVKKNANPMISELLYPSLQAIDEEYLNVDAQLGGVDQRKIMMHARKLLPKLGYNARIEMMTPLLSALNKKNNIKEKMSASTTNCHIDILDSISQIALKINKTFCPNDEDNAILQITKLIIFPILKRRKIEQFALYLKKATIPKLYSNYNILEKEFFNGIIHPSDFKNSVFITLNELLTPIRDNYSLLVNSKEILTSSK